MLVNVNNSQPATQTLSSSIATSYLYVQRLMKSTSAGITLRHRY